MLRLTVSKIITQRMLEAAQNDRELAMRWDGKKWFLDDPELEARILKLDLSNVELRKNIQFCNRCSEQLPDHRVGPIRCAICNGTMYYVRFDTQEELDNWRMRQQK